MLFENSPLFLCSPNDDANIDYYFYFLIIALLLLPDFSLLARPCGRRQRHITHHAHHGRAWIQGIDSCVCGWTCVFACVGVCEDVNSYLSLCVGVCVGACLCIILFCCRNRSTVNLWVHWFSHLVILSLQCVLFVLTANIFLLCGCAASRETRPGDWEKCAVYDQQPPATSQLGAETGFPMLQLLQLWVL